MRKLYSGWIQEKAFNDGYALYLSSLYDPLVEELEWIKNKRITVRYWITDKESTMEEADEAFINTIFGKTTLTLRSVYSEITGYLWTDEDLIVGGHNLLEELYSSIGKYLILEIINE